jgi:hypothetical protein
MLRFEVREVDGEPLPPVDLAEAVVVIGSAPDARIRLPAGAGTLEVRASEVGEGRTYELGRYRVRVAPAPAGAVAASPQRTESLARELMRNLLGAGGAPTLEVETGPRAGARRPLAAPESVLVIGRGDEAGWIIDDEELSRAHAEVRRGWDGAWVRDLGSKNGTRLEGEDVGERAMELHDGAVVELGKLKMRFRDPAEAHLRGGPVQRSSTSTSTSTSTTHVSVAYYAAIAIAVIAVVGLVWILTS